MRWRRSLNQVGSVARGDQARELAQQWRRLARVATAVAILTSPVAFIWFREQLGWGFWLSLLGTFLVVIAFRGFVDLVFRRFIPWPSLFGTDGEQLQEEDVMYRRRSWFWRRVFRLVFAFVFVITSSAGARHGHDVTWWGTASDLFTSLGNVLSSPTLWTQLVFVVFLFMSNFLIFMGPLMLMGIMQIQAFEPGDADWGVRALRRARAGGGEGGGPPGREALAVGRGVRARRRQARTRPAHARRAGTGKTMLSKAIATGFNCFAGDVAYLTPDGTKTFAETVGTSQTVLNGNGEWVPAEIRAFGAQPLVEIELRPGHHTRSNIRRRVRATPDHRWVTANRGLVTDLRAGDAVPFNGHRAGERVLDAFIRGVGFGDGTLDTRGRARIRLCGEKDRALLPLFEEYGHCFVTWPPSYGGDPLVVFNGGHMADWKELPARADGS